MDLIYQYHFLMKQAAEYRWLVANRAVDCAAGAAAPAPAQQDSWSVVAQCASRWMVRKDDFNDLLSFSTDHLLALSRLPHHADLPPHTALPPASHSPCDVRRPSQVRRHFESRPRRIYRWPSCWWPRRSQR